MKKIVNKIDSFNSLSQQKHQVKRKWVPLSEIFKTKYTDLRQDESFNMA